MKRTFLSWMKRTAAAVLAAAALTMPTAVLAAGAEDTAAPEASLIEMEDGEYAIDVELEGGSGKSTISSPAVLIVRDGRAYARIEWSSSHYDYMKIGSEQYFPVNDEGNSTFEIPVTVFDKPMDVIGDTTAMSMPHEVEYTLNFHRDSISSGDQSPRAAIPGAVYIAGVVIVVCAVLFSYRYKKKKDSGK